MIFKIDASKVKCDNPGCGYIKHFYKSDKKSIKAYVKEYLNVPCPKCGSNLLTEKEARGVITLGLVFNLLNFAFNIFVLYLIVKFIMERL